jgi:lipid-A-disaccharide synthase
MKTNLLVVAGEVSGDLHAAEVIKALKTAVPELSVWGIGGDRLKEEGMLQLEHTDKMAVMGLVEVLRHYRFFKATFQRVLEEVDRRKPAAALLVDYPGFNLRLAQALKQKGIPVFYYISPKVWAWNKKRIPKMAQSIDHLMVVFPFELPFFENSGLRVDFVGNPLVSQIDHFLNTEWERLPWKASPWVALLPGSRKQEIERILPPMLAAARILQKTFPNISFIIPAPNARIQKIIKKQVEKAIDKPTWLEITQGNAREVLRQAEAAMVASGTATLEAALLGTPHILVYKTSPATYWLARTMIKITYLGLVNIIGERTVSPELIQHAATPEALAKETALLLEDPEKRQAMLDDFKQIRAQLGEKEAAKQVAEILLKPLGFCRSQKPL